MCIVCIVVQRRSQRVKKNKGDDDCMKILKLEVGQLGANCYIAYCEKTMQGAIIDPGGNGEDILAILSREGIDVLYILNTHGHADHIAANDDIKKGTGAPVLIHSEDASMLTSATGNLSMYAGGQITCQEADGLLSDGQTIVVGEIEIQVIHTPGHTPGGVCFKMGDVLFSGDTLFQQSIGRTDFPGGSHSQIISSIKNKLLSCSDNTMVLPGHGPATSIGDERQSNPYLQ